MKTALAAAVLAMCASASSAVSVAPGGVVGIQIAGSYETDDGLAIGAGSVLNIVQEEVSIPNVGTFFLDPSVSSINPVGPVDLQGLSEDDVADGFVGDSITVDLGTVPTFDFTLLATGMGAVNSVFVASSKVNTTSTSLPAGFGDDTKLEGLGTLDGADASWSFSISGDNPTGDFTLFISVPPDLTPVNPIPLPAGGMLLLSGLGAAAFVRRKRA